MKWQTILSTLFCVSYLNYTCVTWCNMIRNYSSPETKIADNLICAQESDKRWLYIDVWISPMLNGSTINTAVMSLQGRHDGRDSVSNQQPYDCLLNRLFKRRSKKTSKLRVTGLCAGNSPGTGEFPARMASNAENVSIWWRHHVCKQKWRFTVIGISIVKIFSCHHHLNQ